MVSRTRSILAEALTEGPIRKDAARSKTQEFARLLEQQVAQTSNTAAAKKETTVSAPAPVSSPLAAVQAAQPKPVAAAIETAPAAASLESASAEASVETAAPAAATAETAAPKAETVVESGAPRVVLSNEPGLEGAARNPFFGFAEGRMPTYRKWFQADEGCNNARGTILPYGLAATAEGAAEALRLVQQFEPGATMREVQLPGQAEYGHGASAYLIDVPSGRNLNAGLVLEMYYMEGRGCSRSSEATLRNEVLLGQTS